MILVVCLLIAVSELVLRRGTHDDDHVVRMRAYPVLTVAAILGIVAILVQMAVKDDTRSPLLLSMLSWAVALLFYVASRRFGRSSEPDREPAFARL